MHSVEAFPEVFCWIALQLVATAQAKTAGRRGSFNHTPYVVHVDEDMAGYGVETLSGVIDGTVHGVRHPNLGHKHHEAETNGSAITGRMMAVIVHKI